MLFEICLVCEINEFLHFPTFNDDYFRYNQVFAVMKYLGLLIDSNLTWKYHINRIACKINKSILGIIARLRHFVPTSTLIINNKCFN
jgi:hypothetical protein